MWRFVKKEREGIPDAWAFIHSSAGICCKILFFPGKLTQFWIPFLPFLGIYTGLVGLLGRAGQSQESMQASRRNGIAKSSPMLSQISFERERETSCQKVDKLAKIYLQQFAYCCCCATTTWSCCSFWIANKISPLGGLACRGKSSAEEWISFALHFKVLL